MKNCNNSYDKRPAIVKFIGQNGYGKFTYGKEYEAFFIEYWQGERNSLHVRGNNNEITDFNPLENFEIVSDEDNVLNFHEAIVECLTDNFDNSLLNIKYGKQYKAIGRDKNNMFLIMDESYDCYFYPCKYFKIIKDEFDILSHCSIYYSYDF